MNVIHVKERRISGFVLTAGCAERIYCSKECQTKDWKEHKPTCKPHRVDIASLYPVLASLQDCYRSQGDP
ncbi:hypothetical protein JAAARDRAFT_211088, partial [Jaapia argillacea MUCL 33604]